jgi:ankyrin repeat protein
MLLEKGAHINQRDGEGYTAFERAIFATGPRADLVILLVNHGANIHVKDSKGNTPLLAIIQEIMAKDDTKIALFLIEKGADISTPDRQGYTPLHKAVRYNHREITKALIAKGADVNMPNLKGTPPLVTAAKRNFADMVDILLAAPAIAVNATNRKGQSAMDVAARSRIINALEAKGAKANKPIE